MRLPEARRLLGELRGLLEQEQLDRALLQVLTDRIGAALRDPLSERRELLAQAIGLLCTVRDGAAAQAYEVLSRRGAEAHDEAIRWLDVCEARDDDRVQRALELLEQVRSSIAVTPLRFAARGRT